mmetsp:Transcript_10811/g.29884  ORF Transcript_10811/g.29884 Transcript_10811/m.29884 type:complete len:220 (+) Transcript_10811:96-755(+)
MRPSHPHVSSRQLPLQRKANDNAERRDVSTSAPTIDCGSTLAHNMPLDLRGWLQHQQEQRERTKNLPAVVQFESGQPSGPSVSTPEKHISEVLDSPITPASGVGTKHNNSATTLPSTELYPELEDIIMSSRKPITSTRKNSAALFTSTSDTSSSEDEVSKQLSFPRITKVVTDLTKKTGEEQPLSTLGPDAANQPQKRGRKPKAVKQTKEEKDRKAKGV